MYQVFAFYPNLGIKVRLTEYSSTAEMYEYISGLRLCDTPYVAYQNYKKMVDLETYDMTREQLAQMLSEYFKSPSDSQQ